MPDKVVRTVEPVDAITVILRLKGKINMSVASNLKLVIAGQVALGHIKIVVDMEDIDFIDSSGIGALINGLKVARLAGGDLRIANPQKQVLMVLKLMNMDRLLKIYPNAKEAFNA